MIRSTAFAAGAVAALTATTVAQQNADFEDVAPASSFPAGAAVVSQGVNITITDLVTTSFTTSGAASVFGPASDETGAPGTPSNELQPNNVTANFAFDATYSLLSFDFAEFGGVNTFEINGDKREFGNMAAFFATAPTIGGVTFSVVSAPVAGGDRGTVTGVGAFNAVSIGGQELFLDNIRAVPSPGGVAALALGGLAAARRRRG